jgi:mannose-6-phosphate isomerase-like protein (cupin superfamily)
MNVMKKTSVPRYKRDNITSYLLVSEITGGSKNLTITLVEMEPGGVQHLHSHMPEQMYYILEGKGLMTIDSEQQVIEAGDCVFFSSFSEHSLKNIENSILRYLSAASPSFNSEECMEFWPLKSISEEKRN